MSVTVSVTYEATTPALLKAHGFAYDAHTLMMFCVLPSSCIFPAHSLGRSYYTATCRAIAKTGFSLLAFICTDLTFVFSRFTEYLTAFYIQNEKPYPNRKEVNSAFTQHITYMRVKASRKAKTVDMTGL